MRREEWWTEGRRKHVAADAVSVSVAFFFPMCSQYDMRKGGGVVVVIVVVVVPNSTEVLRYFIFIVLSFRETYVR